VRVSMGSLSINGLENGSFRLLSLDEIKALFQTVKL